MSSTILCYCGLPQEIRIIKKQDSNLYGQQYVSCSHCGIFVTESQIKALQKMGKPGVDSNFGHMKKELITIKNMIKALSLQVDALKDGSTMIQDHTAISVSTESTSEDEEELKKVKSVKRRRN